MNTPINNSYSVDPLYQQLSQHTEELAVLGQLKVGDKLMVVKAEGGEKPVISEKSIFQGITRTITKFGWDVLATAQDTVSYVQKLNNRTLTIIATLQDLSNLNKDELQSYQTVLGQLKAQTIAALRGLESLKETYQGKVTADGKSVPELLDQEKMRMELTLKAGDEVYEHLKREPFQRMLAFNHELEVLQRESNQEAHQMNQAESSELTREIRQKKEQLQGMLYETRLENDPTKLDEVRGIAKTKTGKNQFIKDFHRWTSVALNGAALFNPETTNVKKSYEEIIHAIGEPQTLLMAPLITQTCLADLTTDIFLKYEGRYLPTSVRHEISININKGEVHLELKSNLTLAMLSDKKDKEYACSRIIKREIIIPLDDLNRIANSPSKTGPIEFPNIRVIDSYSREIPDAELARELMKFA